jgi:hypothetical protein
MPESRSGVSAFETRLAAMDQRLRELQEELTPSSAPPGDPLDNGEPAPRASIRPGAIPAAPTPAPAAPSRDILVPLYERLLASMRELLAGYELVVGAPSPAPRSAPDAVTVSAGPFSGTPALRDFERALSELPGVRGVSLRGYDTDDRAVWDVELR